MLNSPGGRSPWRPGPSGGRREGGARAPQGGWPGLGTGLGLVAALAPGGLTGLSLPVESALALSWVIWDCAARVYPLLGPLSLLRRARFMWTAWRQRRHWRALRGVAPDSALGRAMAQRRQMAHLLAWPYLNRAWSLRQRVETVVAHYDEIERRPWLQVPPGQRAVLARLALPSGELSLELDQPGWMAQEGELTLSLFQGDLRLYALAFTIGRRQGRPVVYLGAIQGRSLDGAQQRYAELTRELHGCRPRDLLLRAMLMLAEALEIGQVFAVCDYYRQDREPRLFTALDRSAPSADYDVIWRDRGGVETVDGFFALSSAWAPRPPDSVPAKKRAMYRRRQALLGDLRETIQALASHNRPPQALIVAPAC